MISRRGLLSGLAASLAAPAIVRAGVLMPMSSLWTPVWVPPLWFLDRTRTMLDLRRHGWPNQLSDTWIDITNCDMGVLRNSMQSLAGPDEDEGETCLASVMCARMTPRPS